MADVTISGLSTGTPNKNSVFPFSDGSATYKTFFSSISSIFFYSVDYLVVGGGGGGGQDFGGCGGAGGYLEGTTSLMVNQRYDVVVGKGGLKESSLDFCTNGQDSYFGNILAFGGGAGGPKRATSASGNSGGSGGGGYYTGFRGGLGVTGQGNDGAPGLPTGSAGYAVGGGGGGAGATGSSSVGGIGKFSSITGTTLMYASGGTHRGNVGSVVTPDPRLNSGVGGDGANGSWLVASNGAAGIVVIAYPGTPRGTAYNSSGAVIAPNTSSRPGFTIHTFTSSGYYLG